MCLSIRLNVEQHVLAKLIARGRYIVDSVGNQHMRHLCKQIQFIRSAMKGNCNEANLNMSRNKVSLWLIPRIRSQISKLCMRIASTSTAMLSSSVNVENSTAFPYAARNGTAGRFSVKNKRSSKSVYSNTGKTTH